MKVTTKGHTITIKDTEGNIASFLEKINPQYNPFPPPPPPPPKPNLQTQSSLRGQ